MKICIIGTRGVPNYYGGFEQFAAYLSEMLVGRGHQVNVYNSHYHPYQQEEWKGVKIIHKYDPEEKIGTTGQFLYDLNCILDARSRNFDIILQLGYTSSSIWGRFLPSKAKVVTNMDGLEWKRTKYSRLVQQFLLYAEKLGVKFSDNLVSDSIGIQQYLKKKYGVNSTFIPYGSNCAESFSEEILKEYHVEANKFSMLIARLEPENSIEIILDGVEAANDTNLFLVVGNHETKYGLYLKKKFANCRKIRFVGGLYDINKLNSLRFYAKVYFHGHTVGGTNPSLLEAMGSKALICANDNVFNRSVLGDDALYFQNADDVKNIIEMEDVEERDSFVENNYRKIKELYSWERIVSQYEDLFLNVLS
jgi:glycosyltransferase involved in cell wall biosynthesis